jgi:hypothetical protein
MHADEIRPQVLAERRHGFAYKVPLTTCVNNCIIALSFDPVDLLPEEVASEPSLTDCKPR